MDCRGIEALFQACADRRAEPGARVSAGAAAKRAVVAVRDVVEAGAVQVQCRRDEAEFRSERGEEAGIERRDGAGAADNR